MLYVGSERRQKPPSSLNSCLRHRLVAFQSPYAQSLFRTLSLNIPETFCQLLCSINPNSVAFLAIITSIIISITIYHLHSSISFFSQSFDIFACLKMGRIFIMTTTKIKMKMASQGCLQGWKSICSVRRYFEFIHDLRIFLIAFQVYSVSMFPSIVFISIDLCMDYVNRLYCNKWEKRKIWFPSGQIFDFPIKGPKKYQ